MFYNRYIPNGRIEDREREMKREREGVVN